MKRIRIQRLLGVAMAITLLASMGLASATGLMVAEQEMLTNGSFEGGFSYVPGCGAVGTGWGCFTNGGTVDYGFYDDQWQSVVADGVHSQLIELSTMQYAATEGDRFAGISQTVKLIKGQEYTLKLQGLIREDDPFPGEDMYRYRVQWGYTAVGGSDWTQVNNWLELPWDKIDVRTAPTGMESFATKLVAPSDQITLFIRVWKKWGTTHKEINVNLDAISLVGLAVKAPVVPAGPVVILPGPVVVPGPITLPGVAPVAPGLTCGGPNLITNGDFENGFLGGVGMGWTAYQNGGRANYGFYHEMWPAVIQSGNHGQLIEINTMSWTASDPDRVAGITQTVSGLTPGATYELSLYGMMRERFDHSDEDAFRYRVQWGYAPADANPSQADITNWVELPWDDIYLRTAPGDMSFYSVKFQAPASKIVLALQGWKKWGTPQRELDVNLDAIKLVGCAQGIVIPDPTPPDPAACVHVVARGETLSQIALNYGTTVAVLAEQNQLFNPNILLVGQELTVPCLGQQPVVVPQQPVVIPEPVVVPQQPVVVPEPVVVPQQPVVIPEPVVVPQPVVIPEAKPSPQPACIWHEVVPGDTLYGLAAQYNSSLALIMEYNRLANPNLIYVGQKLCIVDP